MRERNIWDNIGDFYHEHTIARAPAEVMEWPLVKNDWQCMTIIICYSLFVNYIGPSIMRNKQPFDLRWLMVPYNIFLVISSFWMFFEFAKIRWLGLKEISCDVDQAKLDLASDPLRQKLLSTIWYFYISKIVELLDTVIFVLRKKERQLSRLHIIHHTMVPLVVLYMLRSTPREYNSFFPLANSFVHGIMYTYYGIAALGNEVSIHLKFKRYVTIIQLIQFILVLYYFISRPFYGCTVHYVVGGMNLLIAGFFFVLFINFYYHEYIKNEQEKMNGVAKAKDS